MLGQLLHRMRMSVFVIGTILTIAVSVAEGQIFQRHRQQQCDPIPYCPPAQPGHYPPGYVPPQIDPTKPDTTPPKKDETPVQPTQPEAPQLPAESFAALGAATFSAPTSAPNMFGAPFGGSGGGVIITRTRPADIIVIRPGTLNGQSASLLFEGSTFTSTSSTSGIYTWNAGSSAAKAIFVGPTGISNLDLSTFPPPGQFTQDGPNFFNNPSAPFPPPSSSASNYINLLTQPNQPLFTLAEMLEKQANPNVTLASFSAQLDNQVLIGPPDSLTNTFPLDYGMILQSEVVEVIPGNGEIVITGIIANLPNPANGGMVGRLQMGEDISPLPRDRFIFDYDYFNNVPLTANGWDVHRYVIGVEKTLFNQRASIELRIPFAATLTSDVFQGAESTTTELGNIRLLLKALLYGSETINVASGMAIHVPTTDDTQLSLADGTPLVRIENETVVLTPYIGALFTPTERLFAQTWLAFNFDTSGNPVFINPTLTNLEFAGRVNAPTVMEVDGQIGYWVYRASNPNALLTGLAPFVELHYFTTVGDTDIVAANGFLVGDLVGDRDELDLTAGVLGQLGSRSTLSLGAVVPLRSGEGDRSFDFQFGLRLNIFYGPTARDLDRTLLPSSF